MAPAVALAFAFAACSTGPDTATGERPLVAECVATATAAPAGAWVCPASWTAECNTQHGATVDRIYVASPATLTCADVALDVPAGPFPVGTSTIVVHDVANGGSTEVCRAALTVVDTRPPVVADRNASLWPPNHKMHAITPADCVEVQDDCDANVRVTFTSVSSDEPVNANGDGNTDPDIAVDGCDRVELRAERAGGGNGRVYSLGWHAEDDAGNAVDGTCHVRVPHDQGGDAAIDDGVDHGVAIPHCTP